MACSVIYREVEISGEGQENDFEYFRSCFDVGQPILNLYIPEAVGVKIERYTGIRRGGIHSKSMCPGFPL